MRTTSDAEGKFAFLGTDRVESLHAGECFDQRNGLLKGAAVEFDQAGAALELVGGESGERFARTAGGKFVARTGQKIAHRNGRITTEENGAGRDQLRGERARFFHLQGHVLGCVGVGQTDGFVHRADQRKRGIFERSAEDFAARQGGRLLCHFTHRGLENSA